VHATHDPPLQTWLVPQLVPFDRLVALTHVETPPMHDVVPCWQRLPLGLQTAPAVHATHAPLLQTWLVPHVVPFATFVTLEQAIAPLAQDVVPVWQTLPPGLHIWPAVHAVHAPLLQTMFVPHEVPLVAFTAPAHVNAPVEHE
jgi:hypothetical protein